MGEKFKFTKTEKSWITYDAGNSAFTMLVSSIIPIYFTSLVTKEGMNEMSAMQIWSFVLSFATVIVALLSPIMGAMADHKNMKKRFFSGAMAVGVIGAVALGIVDGWVAYLCAFLVAKVGYSASLVFYDGMLTDVTRDERMDRVSTMGYAIGYIASCVPFIVAIALIQLNDVFGLTKVFATQCAFFVTVVWWVLLTIPLFKNYKQVYYVEPHDNIIKESFGRLWKTLKNIRQEKHIFLFMLAFFFYIDGVYTIIEMAASFGKAVGIETTQMIYALLATQIIAFPFAIIFGRLAKKYSPRILIQICICGYIFITLFALQMDQAWKFWFLAVLVAMFQGGIQALSRSYFARIIPKDRANEYFGLFDIFGKYAGFFGTLIMGLTVYIIPSANFSIIGIVPLFVIGLIIMRKLPKEEDRTIVS